MTIPEVRSSLCLSTHVLVTDGLGLARLPAHAKCPTFTSPTLPRPSYPPPLPPQVRAIRPLMLSLLQPLRQAVLALVAQAQAHVQGASSCAQGQEVPQADGNEGAAAAASVDAAVSGQAGQEAYGEVHGLLRGADSAGAKGATARGGGACRSGEGSGLQRQPQANIGSAGQGEQESQQEKEQGEEDEDEEEAREEARFLRGVMLVYAHPDQFAGQGVAHHGMVG